MYQAMKSVKFFKIRVALVLVASLLTAYQTYHSMNPWLSAFLAFSQGVLLASDCRNVHRGAALRK
jgi:hypothetical protein